MGDGHIVETGRYFAGHPLDLGPMALLGLGGVKVAVTTRPEQAADPAMFRHLGVDVATVSILVLKSTVHFRADFHPIVADILDVEAPAPNLVDNRKLDFQELALRHPHHARWPGFRSATGHRRWVTPRAPPIRAP